LTTDESAISEAFKEFFSRKATSLIKEPKPDEICAKLDEHYSNAQTWDLTTNFRPICLTSNISKIVEAVVRASVIDKIENILP